MADLLLRDSFDTAAQWRLTRAAARHRQQLVELMGHPPDPARVPSEFWPRIQSEWEDELAVVLALVFVSSAVQHGLTESQAKARAPHWAQQRAQRTAHGYAANTRQQLAALGRRWVEQARYVTRAQVAAETKRILGPSRVQRMAITENTKAITAGVLAASGSDAEAARRRGWILVWTLGPCMHCTFCATVAGTDISVWGRYLDGPPAHPNCCCSLDLVPVGSRTRRPPPPELVEQAARETGLWESAEVDFRRRLAFEVSSWDESKFKRANDGRFASKGAEDDAAPAGSEKTPNAMAAASSELRNFMPKVQRDRFYIDQLGHSQQAMDMLDRLFRGYTINREFRDIVTGHLKEHIQNETPEGKLLTDMIQTQTGMLQAWADARKQRQLDQNAKTLQQAAKEIQRSGSFPYDGQSYDDLGDLKQTLDAAVAEPVLYQQRDTDEILQPWQASVSGQRNEKAVPVSRLIKDGWGVLAGLTGNITHEDLHEITLVNLRELTGQGLQGEAHGDTPVADRTKADSLEPIAPEPATPRTTARYDPKNAKLDVRVANPDAIELAKQRIGLEDYSHDDIAKLTGGLDGSLVAIQQGPGGGLRLDNHDDRYRTLSVLRRDASGLYLENLNFSVFPHEQNQGIGTELLKAQVLQAARMGVGRIMVDAIGSWQQRQISCGYYAWPRLGFDAPLPADWKDRFAAAGFRVQALPDELQQAERVSDFFRSEQGRYLWRRYGFPIHLEFDVAAGSIGRKILDAYYDSPGRKRYQEVVASESQARAFEQKADDEQHAAHFDLGLDDDEALLAGIWDALASDVAPRRQAPSRSSAATEADETVCASSD